MLIFVIQSKLSRFIPKKDNIKKQSSFFNCVAYIMKVKYQEYAYKIMQQYTEVMCNPKVKIQFFPELNDELHYNNYYYYLML